MHTCSVTDGLGNTGSNSTTMRIVGKYYIQLHKGSQPSKGERVEARGDLPPLVDVREYKVGF